MIALNLETGKEVAMSWIAIAIEFVKSLFATAKEASVVVVKKIKEELDYFFLVFVISSLGITFMKLCLALPFWILYFSGIAPSLIIALGSFNSLVAGAYVAAFASAVSLAWQYICFVASVFGVVFSDVATLFIDLFTQEAA